MLEVIIERGCQLLQTYEGEKLPRVVATMIQQHAAEPGNCQFTMCVNQPGLCKYDDHKKALTTPAGNTLKGVEIMKFKPAESELIPAIVLCKCQVGFHHNTNHKPHYPAAKSLINAN